MKDKIVIPEECKSIADITRWTASALARAECYFGHGTDNALDEAFALVTQALSLTPDLPAAYASAVVTEEEKVALQAYIRQRIQDRVPVPYLFGHAWFAGFQFRVNTDVLIPRSPIAELCEQGFSPWADLSASPRILDLCTGSGCIAIAAKLHRPELDVFGSDISAAALDVAKENAALHGAPVTWIESDLFSDLPHQTFDIVVSNPPYVAEAEFARAPEEFRREPELALTSGIDGLAHPIRILQDAADYLTENGVLILEVGDSQFRLQQLLPEVPFQWLTFSRGGSGVAMIERSDLQTFAATIAAASTGKSSCP